MQNLATIFDKLLHLLGCQTGNFPPRAREEWGIICFARHQEIYWRIALLAYDEPITTLRGSVEMTGTQKPVSAITFVAPQKVFLLRLFMESGKSCRRLSTNQREVTILTWVLGVNP